ncbi:MULTISPECIES: hypothetical protein [unclassified Burkholderia]|uniref:hypothetical protein n=1 Tax=unclassified Burkholderia TaxID=2613784 RepID=UPI002AB32874|nr:MULTISPECIES: hypothetical protein [unclassified Burkholderia]
MAEVSVSRCRSARAAMPASVALALFAVDDASASSVVIYGIVDTSFVYPRSSLYFTALYRFAQTKSGAIKPFGYLSIAERTKLTSPEGAVHEPVADAANAASADAGEATAGRTG